jgi:FkbM family methyltransferase
MDSHTGRAPLRSRLTYNLMRLSARLKLAEPEVRGLNAVVREGDQVFDVGAAYGMYTFPLAYIVGGEGRVHAFEPQSRQQRTLRTMRRIIRAAQIRLSQSVLGAEHGDHTMVLPFRFGVPIFGHAHVGEGTERALTPQATHTKKWQTPMHTVDSWCESQNIESVSFMKVDVEGFEPSVLAGATRTIERSRPSMLLEIEDRHLGRYGRDANQFADEIRTKWPEYGMYTWFAEAWKPTDTVRLGVRNYLFATDEAFARAR